jgi:16S rRNA C967 or C1407 C5-methylase (RsmB/RsmF family)
MAIKGFIAFDQHYRTLFPDPKEYGAFIKAISTKRQPVLVYSPHQKSEIHRLWQSIPIPLTHLSYDDNALIWPDKYIAGDLIPGYEEHLLYPLSESSLFPVMALEPKPDDVVLDACAAPGGKSLLISYYLKHQSQLVANDLSPRRVQKMHQLFYDYGQTDITVLGGPAEHLWYKYSQTFDKILLDAPCSSEQHIYSSPKHLAQWSEKRIKKLAHRQYLLIKMLIRCLKPGGTLVYSTCAIAPEENELLVERVIQKLSPTIALIPWHLPVIPVRKGMNLPGLSFSPSDVYRVLPHRDNLDPMFIAIFQKEPLKLV